MKNIHIIPTDKPSRLCFRNYLFINKDNIGTYSNVEFKNIYITSDEIEKEDWCLDLKTNKMFKAGLSVGDEYKELFKKIILTDNKDLIKDGIQAIDNEFLEWFVKNPSCEFVEIVKEKIILGEVAGTTYTDFNYKIIIPKEELKTSEEWQKQFPNTKVLDPDGWDRKNYQYSWFEEKITLVEYTTRLYKSSGQCLVTQEEDKQEESLITLKKEVINGLNELLKLNNSIGNFGKPQEESKQETLEEAAKEYDRKSTRYGAKNIFKDGAKWQADRMYSEEDMRKAFEAGELSKEDDINGDGETLFDEWFEQHKNKL